MKNQKKKIIFIYPSMMMGGSTTSLLSILNEFNFEKYEVDILFFENKGQLSENLPKEVNILSPAFNYKNKQLFKLRKTFSVKSILASIKGKSLIKRTGISYIGSQIRDKDIVRYCRKIDKEYDVAISFLELWPTYYCIENIIAKKKISWIHVDYKNVGFLPQLDYKTLNHFDKLVLVSKECLANFNQIFPVFQSKSVCIENILSSNTIRKYAEYKVNYNNLVNKSEMNFATVCRVVFNHKGLDRGVRAIAKLVEEELVYDFHWHIIGDGPDFKELQEMIHSYKLDNYITLYGAKPNPFPYIKDCDVFFLPSHYEGKPMAVTEAQMLGLVPVVTNYASATEQIDSGENGIIMENNEDAIYFGLKRILQSRDIIKTLKDKVLGTDYSNREEMRKIYKVIEE